MYSRIWSAILFSTETVKFLRAKVVFGFPVMSFTRICSGSESSLSSRPLANSTVLLQRSAGIDVSFMANDSAKHPPRQSAFAGHCLHSKVWVMSCVIFCVRKPRNRSRPRLMAAGSFSLPLSLRVLTQRLAAQKGCQLSTLCD